MRTMFPGRVPEKTTLSSSLSASCVSVLKTTIYELNPMVPRCRCPAEHSISVILIPLYDNPKR